MIVVVLQLCWYDGESFSPHITRRHVSPSLKPHDVPSQQRRSAATIRASGTFVPSEATDDQAPVLFEVNALYDIQTSLSYNPELDRYLPTASSAQNRQRRSKTKSILYTLRAALLPEGVRPSYYNYIKWRIIQRFISAVVHVFGTQSLLLALGGKGTKNLGLGAALTWVLKDALGKITRMIWASKMGRKFDPDAKRWRFRSSLLFALGNFLEIMAFINPALFILYAATSNSLKQISMLTSSATRNAILNSFKIKGRENIGDITAKGEAQIAIVDLFGIGVGVCLSKAIGISIPRVLGLYAALQITEIYAMYREIHAVEFQVLNFERLYENIDIFIQEERRDILTPEQMASVEKIFLAPNNLARRGISFGSFGRCPLNPVELDTVITIFERERFLLVVGPNVKNADFIRRAMGNANEKCISENCHIVLHSEANNVDIVKSTLALCILRKKLLELANNGNAPQRTSECMDVLREVKKETDSIFGKLLSELLSKGWAAPAKFMFGRVSMRAEWPIYMGNRGNQSKTKTLEGDVIANVESRLLAGDNVVNGDS